MEIIKNGIQTEALQAFREFLATFPSQVGKRNPQLLKLVHYGLKAGLEDEQIESEIVKGSGEPPLTPTEIKHALDTAHKTGESQEGFYSRTKKAPPLGPGASTFVPKMIEAGDDATLEKLAARSPVPIPEARAEQTRIFLSTLYADAENLFMGEQMGAGIPGTNILSVENWKKQSALSGPFLVINPLTGESGHTVTGKPSYRCGQCIASRRYALVEFDAMPLEKQAYFWAGVIFSLTLPLRSLVYSGGKSIHGIVEIDAQTPQEWHEEMDKLMYAVAHPASPREHQADTACRNADRLTRLAGAIRPESGALQRLLWLSPKPLGI